MLRSDYAISLQVRCARSEALSLSLSRSLALRERSPDVT